MTALNISHGSQSLGRYSRHLCLMRYFQHCRSVNERSSQKV